MPKEKPYYRETLDRLDEMYPDKEVLNQEELAKFLGVSTRFLRNHWKQHRNKLLGGYAKTKIAAVLAS